VSVGPNSLRLDGRAAIVTGGANGIGRTAADALAACGALVAIVDLDGATAATAAREIEGTGARALAIQGDARVEADWQTAIDQTTLRFGEVRILVNNAGGVFEQAFLDSGEKGWDALLRANLKSVLHGTHFVGRHMRDHRAGGAIVNVVSIEASRAAPGYAVYAAAKAAVVNFTQTSAVELAPHGIRVNAVAPDICMTEGLRRLLPPGREAHLAHLVPLGRAGEPDDVAGGILFLASDLARYVTGATLAIDGGTAAASGWHRDPNGRWSLGNS
jgi:NAD(P)-dependent dehydrogenase (short-subunit alcohol dehydrogenase family)